MFALVKKFFSGAQTTLSPYQEAIHRFQRLSSPTAKVYSDHHRIDVIASSIDRYVEIINEAVVSLENGRLFRSSGFDLVNRSVPCHSFYIDKNGFYVDVAADHHIFISSSTHLLDLYERTSNEINQSGLTQANLFRILPVINNLITLSITLTENPLH